MEIKEIINNILTQVSNGAYNTIGALMVTKLLQTLSDSDNFFKGIFNRLEKEIKQENIIKKEEIEFSKILPIMDGLMLNQDSKPMSEIFYNLLKSSMDKETKDFVHPAFPQILKQMSLQEARFLLDIYNNKISRNYQARVYKDIIYQYDFQIRDANSIITYKDINSTDDYSSIYDRLHFFNLTLIKESAFEKSFANGVPMGDYTTIKDEVILSKFGRNFMDVCYNDGCRKLLEVIDIVEYLKNCINK